MSNKTRKARATLTPRVSIRSRPVRTKTDNIDNRIKRLMDSLGENATEFAARIGVRERTVFYWIDPTDNRQPRGRTMDKIKRLEKNHGLKGR